MKPKKFVPLVALHLKISLTRVQLQKAFPPLQREVIDRTAKSSYVLDTSLHDFFVSLDYLFRLVILSEKGNARE